MYGASSCIFGGPMHVKAEIDPETGYQYVIKINYVGTYCGYVVLPATHPLWGKDYFHNKSVSSLVVHGGITWSELLDLTDGKDSQNVNTAWCVGFDTSHVGDYQPLRYSHYTDPRYKDLDTVQMVKLALRRQIQGLEKQTFGSIDSYKDLEYVEAQCLLLAKQLKDLDRP